MNALPHTASRFWQLLFSVAVVLIVVLTAVVVIYPLGTMLVRVFFPEGAFDLSGFVANFIDPSTLEILWNTAVLVGASTVLAVLIGSVLAWLNERTDANFGLLSDLLPLIPLLLPLIASSIGWVFLLAPSAGFINVLWRSLMSLLGQDGAAPLFNIYSMGGMIFVSTLCMVPYAYLMVSTALRSLDPSLEEASRIAGASPLKTLGKVTLPLVMPAIGAAFLLTLIIGLALFSVPVVIGTAARIDVVSVRIFRLLYSAYPPRMDMALSLSLMLMIIVQIAVLLQAALVGRARHARIGGKGQKNAVVELGGWRWVARIAMWVFIAGTTVLPILGLLFVSLQPFWLPAINLETLSLNSFKTVLLENGLTSRRSSTASAWLWPGQRSRFSSDR